MYEACIKTVARTDGINDLNGWWCRRKFFFPRRATAPRGPRFITTIDTLSASVPQRVCRFAFSEGYRPRVHWRTAINVFQDE
jgi:hypothetical protein